MSKNRSSSKEHNEYIKKIKTRNRAIIIVQISILFIITLVWELLGRYGVIDTFLTSYPSEIYALFMKLVKDGSLFHHIGISVFENIIGFLLGTLLGILVAMLLWWSKFLSKVLDPYLVILNSLPKTALAPIIILWIGAGYAGIIATAISVSIVITIMNVYNAFIAVDEEKIKMLKSFGASKIDIFKKVVLPSSIPTMIGTLKVNIGLSWVGVIVGEFLVSKAGIGYLIVYGGQVFKLDLVMMSVIVLAIIASLMYKCVSIIEKKYTRWKY